MNPGRNRKYFALNVNSKCTRKLIIEYIVPDKWRLDSNLLSLKIFNPVLPDSMSKCQTIKFRNRQN